ncbi:hypothetical protein SAMN00768000_3624 [Sulfobacillus thermosulfidooxidans DSM 9293]|uniref:Uncharacterized protein n=1 Tax=Sulfobacillus thermosulfidooxidans (strain DSM 9293 / VKM B-1269 / AT-1) TaxID=929705 RepID=A0A1W1WP15_SULTA|nr:hypothetical protein [Sulfobacillus thermosulfidooxidans]SMC08058.1 hypothetical protein SAMN00768000_3624 [Sulfobacillus thermosulfidooxidans DSM 9293]
MAKKAPTDHTPSLDSANGPRRPLPQPMPVQYHLTIQKSWHVPAIPTVRSSPDAQD